jgi:hypothetical protein
MSAALMELTKSYHFAGIALPLEPGVKFGFFPQWKTKEIRLWLLVEFYFFEEGKTES